MQEPVSDFAVGVYRWLMLKLVETSAAQPKVLREAIGFIHGNAQRDIGLTDIASALNVTPRSVQYAFRRHLNTTPLEYLRRVRLAHAHRELQAADPSTNTVMDIAGRWGFSHAGRFSVIYRETFGNPPSKTLRGA